MAPPSSAGASHRTRMLEAVRAAKAGGEQGAGAAGSVAVLAVSLQLLCPFSLLARTLKL